MSEWHPIDTAPKNNRRRLYLAKFDEDGNLQELDFDGSWQSESESWELPKVYHYWDSANGIEEPTHWAYQDEGIPVAVKGNSPIADLIAEYEADGCRHADLKWVKAASLRYVSTMRDSQVRCLLYTLANAVQPD